MTVDKDTIEKIAHLSRLNFSGEDEAKMLDSLNNIINWVAQLSEVDTEGVQPLTHMTDEHNVWRKDEVRDQLPHDKGLLNAPRKDTNYFRVPKVLDIES